MIKKLSLSLLFFSGSLFANEHLVQLSQPDHTMAEDLAFPESFSPISSFLSTRDFHASKKALIAKATTIDPLVYPHNTPVSVMASINTYPIFWGSSWVSTNTKYISDKMVGLNYFYSNIGQSTYISTANEYVTTTHTAKPSVVVTTKSNSSPSAVLSQVCSTIGTANLDPAGYYPVYSDLKRGNANYCAYHSAGVCGGKTVQFGFFFSVDNDPSCDPQSSFAPKINTTSAQSPGSIAGATSSYTQSQGLAALANLSAHELLETITDPGYFPPTGSGYFGGYYDSTGAEVGDKCGWTYGASKITGKPAGSVMIGTYYWKLQGEWSNAAQKATPQTGYATSTNPVLYGCITGS